LTLDLRDPGRAAGQIAAFAAKHPLHAIIPTDDETAVVAAAASARLGLPHNPPEAARAARRKDELRRILHAARVQTPRYSVMTLDHDPAASALKQGFPVVLKPTFLAASRGVIRADNPEQFVAAFRRIEALLHEPDILGKGGDAARLIVAEEFVPGVEVAVEGLLIGGRLKVLALFDKPDPLDGPFFEETIYVTPSRLAAGIQDAIATTTASAGRALGLREGPVHAELRVNDRGPWLIELAARSIGGLCSRALRFGTGLSLEEVVLMHALGRSVEEIQREPRPAGVMMIPIPHAGVLRGVSGVAAARRVPASTTSRSAPPSAGRSCRCRRDRRTSASSSRARTARRRSRAPCGRRTPGCRSRSSPTPNPSRVLALRGQAARNPATPINLCGMLVASIGSARSDGRRADHERGIIHLMSHILFICSGNTCRSPMAAGIARRIFGQSHLIVSAGAGTSGGDGAATNAASGRIMCERPEGTPQAAGRCVK
ncbi:MAG: hypothetical protein AUI47_04420, partial [Acidobacteria bacterium 13_1_40CM_2_68_5]